MKLYSNTIMNHFKHPRNIGKIKNPDAIGEAGNVVCGDVMRLYLSVKNGMIKDIKFQTLGCVVAIANTSLLTTLVKGKTLKQALKISSQKLVAGLGDPLPVSKVHCSALAEDALKQAIYDYYVKHNIKIPKELEREHQRISKTIHNAKDN